MYEHMTILTGNVSLEPKFKYLPDGETAVLEFGLAQNRSFTKKNGEKVEHSVYFTVKAWRQIAEGAQAFIQKGMYVTVIGTLSSEAWKDNAGTAKSKVVITADHIFLDTGSLRKAFGEAEEGYQHPFGNEEEEAPPFDMEGVEAL